MRLSRLWVCFSHSIDQHRALTWTGPRTRAPLGMKTTNAKAKAFQTPSGPAAEKDLDKTQAKQTSARRPKQKVTQTVKLDIHGDDPGPLEAREVEYAPPNPKALAYESEDFPNNCLNYEGLKPENLMRGWTDQYNNPLDENGVSRREKEFEEKLAKALKAGDERILRAVEEDDWSVADVPETFQHLRKKGQEGLRNTKAPEPAKKFTAKGNKGPATLALRNAATALSVVPKPAAAPFMMNKPKPKPATSFLARGKKEIAPPPTSTMRHTAATAASKSTIGYTKGRSASSIVNRGTGHVSNIFNNPNTLPRSTSNLSEDSDVTITPARFAQKKAEVGSEEWNRLKFLGAFEPDDEDLEPGLRGALPECLRRDDEEEEEFVMTLGA